MKKSELCELIYDCIKDNPYGQDGCIRLMAKSIVNDIENYCLILPVTEKTEKYIIIVENVFKWEIE